MAVPCNRCRPNNRMRNRMSMWATMTARMATSSRNRLTMGPRKTTAPTNSEQH